MASTGIVKEQAREQSTLIGGIGFDRLMAGLAVLFIGGNYLDGWAHYHGLVDTTFFTPWHAVLYSAYLVNAVVLVSVLLINHARGYSWLKALPDGYGLSLLGVPLFFLAGGGDLIWHTLFGIEEGIDPLLSPTHLLLALGGLLIVSGPLRAGWRRATQEHNWSTLLPVVLTLGVLLGIFSFFTSFAHPAVETDLLTSLPYTEEKGSWGAASVLLQSAILSGVVLFALRSWRMPPGALTLMLTLNTTLISFFQDEYTLIIATLVAGAILDLLYWRLQPSTKRLDALRLFAFTFPIIYNLCFFITVMFAHGNITWTIHLWMGVTVMSGVAGLLLSYLMAPTVSPEPPSF
jgi:hypothetical protein